MISVEDFTKEAEKWFAEHTPRTLDFMLPLTFMEVGTDRQFAFLQNWQRQVYEAGFLGAAWPAEYGGGGLTYAHQSAATKIMRRHNAPIMMNAIGLSWAGPLILDMGSEDHKKKYIKGILSADDIWCQGFSEPEHGSDLGNAQLRAVRDGEDYILNGSKIWTTLGHYGKYMILLARTNSEIQNKYAGLSFLLTPMTVPGIRTQKIRKLTGEHGFTQTFFEDARVPADGLMGAEGMGWQIAMQTLEYERGARGGQAGGYSMTEPDPLEILNLARDTGQLADPVVQDDLIDFIIDAQALNLNAQRAKIGALIRDNPAGLALMNKLTKSEFAREINQYALTLQGTRSAYYVDDPNAVDGGWWHRSYLNAFSATIGGGTSQIQRNIIGEHVLGLPKSR